MSRQVVAADGRLVLGQGGGRGLVGPTAILLTVCALIASMLAWAAMATVEEVRRGQGRVVPSQQVQVLSSLEGGVLRAVRVREGTMVSAGDVIVELDPTQARSVLEQARQQEAALRARVARLEAEAAGVELVFPEELRTAAPGLVAGEGRLREARRADLANEHAVLSEALRQRQQETIEAEATVETARTMVSLFQNEIRLLTPLVQRRLEPETNLLAVRRNLADWQGRLGAAELSLPRLRAAQAEVTQRMGALSDRFRAQALTELASARAQLAELEPSLALHAERLARTTLRSPVRGVVNRVLLTTVGGVAQPGMPLAEVVPVDDQLLIEAFIRPSDIADLRPGQPAVIKLSAYDFTRYGALQGELVSVGADAVRLPNVQETAFPVIARATGQLVDAAGRPLEIVPGMVASLDVLVGRRTVLSYLVSPALKLQKEAFRE